MEPIITLKNVELNDAARRHLERNLSKLTRHFPDIDEIKVDLSEQATKSRLDRFVALVTVTARGVLLRGEERGDNLLTAFDRAIEAVDGQIDQRKGKLKDRSRATPSKPGAEETSTTYRVIRKPFQSDPMTTDEAIEKMESSGQDFILFQDADNLRFGLVYKLEGGDYGLIEP